MKNLHSAVLGLIQAAGVVIYTAIIAGLLNLMQDTVNQPSNFVAAAFMLVLLVFSAAICGTLIFGYPVYFTINKNIKKALATLGYTFLYLLVVLVIAIIIISLV